MRRTWVCWSIVACCLILPVGIVACDQGANASFRRRVAKLKAGMSLRDVHATFGEPVDVSSGGETFVQNTLTGKDYVLTVRMDAEKVTNWDVMDTDLLGIDLGW